MERKFKTYIMEDALRKAGLLDETGGDTRNQKYDTRHTRRPKDDKKRFQDRHNKGGKRP